MPRKKRVFDDETNWNYDGISSRERTYAEFAELARATKLRTLFDMSEREIRALEKHYGCPVIRPPKQARRASAAMSQRV